MFYASTAETAKSATVQDTVVFPTVHSALEIAAGMGRSRANKENANERHETGNTDVRSSACLRSLPGIGRAITG